MICLSPKSCIPCRDRKRKCDKLLPCCSLCQRLRRECKYLRNSKKCADPLLLRRGQDGLTHIFQSRPLDIDRTVSYNFSDTVIPENVHRIVTKQLSRYVGTVDQVKEVAMSYFSTIHLWLPVLSEARYFRRLSDIFFEPHAGLSLLTLGMKLITTAPTRGDILSKPLAVYTCIKSMIAIVEAANIHSLEVVQSRLLLSIFEVGHGIEPAAYITIGATARAAAVIGASLEPKEYKINYTTALEESEQNISLWWAIVILARYHTLKQGMGPCATKGLGEPSQLPIDRTVVYESAKAAFPRDISTPSSIRVGSFARQAQVSHIVDRLLTHIHEPTLNEKFNLEEWEILSRTLESFATLLPEDSPQPWPRYCGAIGMCYSGLLTVLESRPTISPKGCHVTTSFPEPILLSALSRISEIARRFNEQIDVIKIEALSPFVPHSLYKAIIAQRRLYRKKLDRRILAEINSLETMLKHFSKRWSAAGQYLQLSSQLPDNS